MPNVPQLPGVPSLSSYGSLPSPILAVDTLTTLGGGLQQLQWGIYTQDGTPIIASSLASLFSLGSLASALNSVGTLLTGQPILDLFSIVDFEFKQDWSISTYPVENGGFQSYDKVQLPFDVRMRVAAGFAESNRTALINAVESIANTLDLFNVVTPEETYVNCNVTHYDYKRVSNNGVGIIVIDIWLTEVRVTSTVAFSNTQQPGSAGITGTGSVQPVPYTASGSAGVPFT